MDCSNFWEDMRKEKERIDNLSPEEKLTEEIDKMIKNLNHKGKQSVRDCDGYFLGIYYLFADYEIEEILSTLKEIKYKFNINDKEKEE